MSSYDKGALDGMAVTCVLWILVAGLYFAL